MKRSIYFDGSGIGYNYNLGRGGSFMLLILHSSLLDFFTLSSKFLVL